MRVKVVYLGGSRVQAECTREEVTLAQGATIHEAAAVISQIHPALGPLLSTCRWARNLEFSSNDEELADGDELALLPPVSGGAPLATLTTEDLDPAEVLSRVSDDRIGATVVFVGTVRNHSQHGDVHRLEYEAYEKMAVQQLERIAEDCGSAQTRVAIAHRHGRLAVGDLSVVIAAASPHRAEAFEACRQAIEKIKADVPIWKKEIATDGESWVGWGGG